MDMKIDATQIRELREARAWSQEHLAELSGLSVRTIQRLERDGNASHESRLALAAAFGIAVGDLAAVDGSEAVPAGSVSAPANAPAESRGTRTDRRRAGFQAQWVVYVVVCSGLFWLDWHRDGALQWAYWPALGWGIGLALQAWRRFGGAPSARAHRLL